jgi:signal transduction histidine kinase
MAVMALACVGDSAGRPGGHGGFSEVLGRVVSPRLRALDGRREELRREMAPLPRARSGRQSERLGYHSPFRTPPREPERPMWIQIDLGQAYPLDAIAVVPAEAKIGGEILRGYGFPRRFRIEVAGEGEGAAAATVADHTAADFPNPGNYPVLVELRGKPARFVRLTATALHSDGERFFLALGEIFVLSGNRDVAIGKAVTVSDPFPDAPTWSAPNLVDAQSVLGPPVTEEPSPSNGYHSKSHPDPDHAKWVQVDLGRSFPLDEIRLFPARPRKFPPDQPNYGFPRRFRVDLSDDESFATSTAAFDSTGTDFHPPWDNAVVLPLDRPTARFVRVTATRLSRRRTTEQGETTAYMFSFAELQAFSGGRNVALGARVTAADSARDNPQTTSWATEFLVDGYASDKRVADWGSWLRALARRGELEAALARLESERPLLVDAILTRAARTTAAGGSFALAGVVALLWRARVQSRRRVEKLRAQIARDLHDDIGSNLASIALLSELSRTGGAAVDPAAAARDLEEINRIARRTNESIRDIVWLIDSGETTIADLARRMRGIAETMLSGKEHSFDCPAADLPARPLPLATRRHLLLIFKEVLHNITKHADARRVTITLSFPPGALRLTVHDDGRGFHPEAPRRGHGLGNLRRRAEVLGGALTVRSRPGEGTTVEYEGPIR